MARILLRVVWGLLETMATLVCIKALTNVDLPTLVRPSRATYPECLVLFVFTMDAHAFNAIFFNFQDFKDIAFDGHLVVGTGNFA